MEKILHQKVDVFRNDKIALETVKEYDKIILSPGPGVPDEAGLLLPLIKEYAATKSILGVCLGPSGNRRGIGGRLVNLSTVYHGVATDIRIVNGELCMGNGEKISGDKTSAASTIHHSALLFNGLPQTFAVGRYHSWIVSDENFPEDLEVTARDENNYIMALQHKKYDVQGVQFHPESVLTPDGEKIMRNWLTPFVRG